jgi:nucleoside-diphosphate-sugar epimerase
MSNSKTILITGASGFIGSFLTDEAIERGYTVFAAVRRSTDTSALRKKDVHIVEINFHDEESVCHQLSSLPAMDFVIHNAGLTRARNSDDYYEVNYGNTRRLIEGLKASTGLPQKFIYISSVAAQGPFNGNAEVHGDAFSNSMPLTEYGRSKLAAEQYIEKMPGLAYVIIRPTAVYGPGDHDFLKVVKFLKKGIDFRVGTKPQKLSFIYVKDLVRVVFDALESTLVNRLWFISDGGEYNHLDLGKAVSKCLNRKVVHIPVPVKLAMIIGVINETIAGLSKKSPLINREKLTELSAANWSYDIESISNDLGFKAEFDLYSGMKETVEWYKKEGLI